MNLCNIRNQIIKGESIYHIPLRVTFYARVSTDKDEQLNSLDNQVLYFKNLIQENVCWQYVDGYIDEGISGTSVKNRNHFLKMIQDGKKGMFDLILTKEISRFSRNTVDSIKYTQELLSYNVGVLFLSDNINTILPDSELRLTIMSSIAQEEVRKLSERVRFGLKRSREKGRVLGNNVITGYTKEKGKLKIDEKEAKMIKRLYSLYASGKYGLSKISKLLYEEGYQTKKGGYIHITTLRRMITNPKYKGFYCTNTVMTNNYRDKKQIRLPMEEWLIQDSKGEIPAIVSEELWNQVNQLLKMKKTNYLKHISDIRVFSKRYPYSGNIYCTYHKCKYKRVHNHGNSYWICNNYAIHGDKTCKSPKLYEKELDKIMKNIYLSILNNFDEIKDKLIHIYKDANYCVSHEIKKLTKEMNHLNNKKENLLELYIEKVIDTNEFENRNSKYNREIKNILKEIKELEKNNIHTTLKQIKEIELGDFIRDNFQKLSEVFLNRIEVKNSNNKTKVILDINVNHLNVSIQWDYNIFDEIAVLCSHNEDYDMYSCFGKCNIRSKNYSRR